MAKEKRLPLFLDYFDNPTSLAGFIRETSVVNPVYSQYNGISKEKDFDGLIKGENKVIKEFHESLMAIEHQDSNYKKVYNVSGARIDMSRAVTGHPKSMISILKRNTNCKRISLMVDMTLPYYVSNGTIREIGKKVLATVSKLEFEGNQLKIYACCAGTDGRKVNCMVVKLKEYGEPLELMKVSYPLSNPNFLRHIYFEWHKSDKRIFEIDGLGHYLSCDFTEDEISVFLSRKFGEKLVFLPFAKNGLDTFSVEKVYDDLKKQIDKVDSTVYF